MQKLGFPLAKTHPISEDLSFYLMIFFASIVFCIGFIVPKNAHAAGPIHTHYHILIDISSSMKGRGLNRNPHSRNNIVLSQNIVNLLDENSSAAISTFGDDATLLIPDEPVTQDYRKTANDKLEPLTLSDQFTDLLAGLKIACMQLSSIHDSQPKKILLVSDGQLDVSHSKKMNAKIESALLSQILPELIKNQIQVYAIAHGKISDNPILKKMSAETHGEFIDLDNINNINETLYDKLISPNHNTHSSLESNNRFIVDGNPSSLHIVIHHTIPYSTLPPLLLRSPIQNYSSQINIANVRWFHTGNLSLISIIKPTPGVWSISGIDPKQNTIGIIDNFQIQTHDLLKTFVAGKSFPYSIEIQNQSRNVSSADIKRLFKVAVVALRGDTITQSSLIEPNEFGVYNNAIQFNENEADKIKIQLYSETFRRALTRQIIIAPMSEKITVTPSNDFELSGFKITVTPDRTVFNTANLNIQPEFTTPMNSPFKVTKNPSDGTWTIDVGKIPLEKKVNVILHYNGTSPDSIPLKIDSKPILLEGYISPEEIKLRKNKIQAQLKNDHSNALKDAEGNHETNNSHSKITMTDISFSSIKKLPQKSLMIISSIIMVMIVLLCYLLISSRKEKTRQIDAIKKEFEDV